MGITTNDSNKIRFDRFAWLVVLLIGLFYLFHNPVNNNSTLSEIGKCMCEDDGITPYLISIDLSEEDEHIIKTLISSSFSTRTILTKSEYYYPGSYYMILDDSIRLSISIKNERPIINCTRYTGWWVMNAEWLIFPSNEKYEKIKEIIELYIKDFG